MLDFQNEDGSSSIARGAVSSFSPSPPCGSSVRTPEICGTGPVGAASVPEAEGAALDEPVVPPVGLGGDVVAPAADAADRLQREHQTHHDEDGEDGQGDHRSAVRSGPLVLVLAELLVVVGVAVVTVAVGPVRLVVPLTVVPAVVVTHVAGRVRPWVVVTVVRGRDGRDVTGAVGRARGVLVAEQVGRRDRGGVLGVAGRRGGCSRTPVGCCRGTGRSRADDGATGRRRDPRAARGEPAGRAHAGAGRRGAGASGGLRQVGTPAARGRDVGHRQRLGGRPVVAVGAAIAAASSAAVHGRRFSTTSSGVSGPSSTWPKVTAHRVSRSFGTSLTTSPGGTGAPPIRGAGSRPVDLAVERPVAGEAGVDQGDQGDGVGARGLLARRSCASLGGGVDAETLELELAAGRAQHAGGLQRLVVQAGRGDPGEHLGGLAHQRAHPVGGQRAVAAQHVGQRVGLDELGDHVGHRPGVAVLLRDVEHPQQGRLVDHRGAAGGVHGVLGGGGGDQAHADRAVQRGVDRPPEVAGRGRAQTLLEAVPPRRAPSPHRLRPRPPC